MIHETKLIRTCLQNQAEKYEQQKPEIRHQFHQEFQERKTRIALSCKVHETKTTDRGHIRPLVTSDLVVQSRRR
ncbi:hypothetical protein Bpfe_010373 [Biomphalaria pfeifferi]|uniref:Uncharacterized protein n=1 Tax=Biomphalaria pfeifferi TaxID=112525 RepID=A0AAD8FE73_BIOPF|nr:hypothetical protein Bpfe_010373 [Biomphalaria pfeifferi]